MKDEAMSTDAAVNPTVPSISKAAVMAKQLEVEGNHFLNGHTSVGEYLNRVWNIYQTTVA